MDETRKRIIVKEIIFWKKHRLLPEQYCDYLLTLYTEGKGIGRRLEIKRQKFQLLWLLLIPIAIFLIYFTELSLILQIAISLIVLMIGTYLIIYFTKKGYYYQIPLIFSAIFFLFVSVEIVQKLYSDHMISLYGMLLFNCLLWLFAGIRFKWLYFTISGIVGMLLLLFFYFFHGG